MGRCWLRLLGLGATAVFAAAAHPCLADVIEISPSGDATTFAKPAVFTPEGVRTIAMGAQASPLTAAADLQSIIAEAALRNQISAELVTAVAWRESRFRQSAVSNRDAVGVMQLTAGAARDLGVDRFDLTQNIHGGAAYLRQMINRYDGSISLALAAYNAGPAAVDRFGGIPPFRETQAYVSAILGRLTPQSTSPLSSLLSAR